MTESPKNSILQPIAYDYGTCGYCNPTNRANSPRTSAKYGLWAHSLTPKLYRQMIDRGWRRSGSYCYKPDLKDSCCKQHTIRLDTHGFKPSRSQRQLLHRFNRYIMTGDTKASKKVKSSQNEFNLTETVCEALKGGTPAQLIRPKARADNGKKSDFKHEFELCLEPASFTKEKYELYKAYQIHTHHDPPWKVKEQAFIRFLCDGPLDTEPVMSGDQEDGQEVDLSKNNAHIKGQYHHLYRIDGKLIAMGVIDILPDCLSSVYLLWHPDYEHLSLGKVSALVEISLARHLNLRYYYMGYFIGTCQKMRYKAEYKPSQLLEPETNKFRPLEEVYKGPLGGNKDTEAWGEKPMDTDQVDNGDEEQEQEDDIDTCLPSPPPPGCDTVNATDIMTQIVIYRRQLYPFAATPGSKPDREEYRLLSEAVSCVGVKESASVFWAIYKI